MPKFIDAQRLMTEIYKGEQTFEQAVRCVRNAPAENVRSAERGFWRDITLDNNGEPMFECSVCFSDFEEEFDYCPACGAIMRW